MQAEARLEASVLHLESAADQGSTAPMLEAVNNCCVATAESNGSSVESAHATRVQTAEQENALLAVEQAGVMLGTWIGEIDREGYPRCSCLVLMVP